MPCARAPAGWRGPGPHCQYWREPAHLRPIPPDGRRQTRPRPRQEITARTPIALAADRGLSRRTGVAFPRRPSSPPGCPARRPRSRRRSRRRAVCSGNLAQGTSRTTASPVTTEEDMTSAGNSCGMTTTTGQRQWNGRRVAISVLAVAAIVAGIVVGRHTLAESLQKLAGLDWTWFVAAIACEFISLTAFGLSRRRLLRADGHKAGFASVMAITYASNALSMTVPFAGAQLAVVFSYRQFRRRGLGQAITGWALAVSAILSMSALAVVLIAGSVASGASVATAVGFAGAAVLIQPAGQPVPWGGLLLAYAAGAAVGSTGLTPGGFALVEATLTAALVAAGMTTSAALTSVLAYRLVNFWMILIGGWAAMIVLTRVRIRTATSPDSPAGPGRARRFRRRARRTSGWRSARPW